MPVTVLESFPAPRPTTNPYIVMLRDALAATPDLQVLTFSWRTALLAPYDVLHVHWPEILVSGRTPARTLARQVLFALLLLRLAARRTPVVRTLHNLDAHEGVSRRQTVLLRLADRLTRGRIVINPATGGPGQPGAQILHGHYRDWFARFPRQDAVPGRLAYVGLVRPYKNVDGLVEAFQALPHLVDHPDRRLTLTVGGKADDESLVARLHELAAADDRVTLDLRYLSDEELVAAVTGAEVVVLPYHEMHNSGSVLAALSLDRPVLVPRNEVTLALAGEVGPGWVHTYDGPLRAGHLAETLARLAAEPATGSPDLSRREWAQAGEQHRAAFLTALGRPGPGHPEAT